MALTDQMIQAATWADANEKNFGFTVDSADGAAALAGNNSAIATFTKSNQPMAEAVFGYAAARDVSVLAWNVGNKVLSGVQTEDFTASERQKAKDNNTNYYSYIQANKKLPVFEDGRMLGGEWLDVKIFIAWFKRTLQVEVFNLLYGTERIPMTQDGIASIEAKIDQVCKQAYQAGNIENGYWSGPGYGNIQDGSFVPFGYVTFPPKLSTILETYRQQRNLLSPFVILLKGSAAINYVNITVTFQD